MPNENQESIDQLEKQIKELTKDALKAAANQLIAESDKWVPVHTGRLKRSAKTSKVDATRNGFEVEVSYGDQETPYAGAQYFGRLNHFLRRGLPVPMTRFRVGASRALAGGNNALYQRSYRAAIKAGVLTKIDLKWLDRALDNGRSRRKIDNTFANFYR